MCIVYYNLFRNPNFKYGPWSETITFGRDLTLLLLRRDTKNFCAHVQITRIVLIPTH